jgi:hypothetical protein
MILYYYFGCTCAAMEDIFDDLSDSFEWQQIFSSLDLYDKFFEFMLCIVNILIYG